MGDWRDHVVPDWVVDDYNSRVSAEDRLPLPTGKTYEDTDIDTGSYSSSNLNGSAVAKDYFDVNSSLSKNYVERHNSSSENSNHYNRPLYTYYDSQAERRTSLRAYDNDVGKLAVFLLIVFWFIGMYFFTWLLS